MSNRKKTEYIISFPQQWQNVVHPNAGQWTGPLKCDGMTDVTVKILKVSCVPARTHVRRKLFLDLSVISVICHW